MIIDAYVLIGLWIQIFAAFISASVRRVRAESGVDRQGRSLARVATLGLRSLRSWSAN
jgi:hypothetical protein